MKVIVTGAAGQLGSFMVDYLLENTSHDVVGVIRRSSNSNLGNLTKSIGNPRFRISYADLTDKTSVNLLCVAERPDYFINFAGNSFLGNSWNAPYSHFEINFTAVLHQLEGIRLFCPFCRYFNAGSSEQFGETIFDTQNEETPFSPRNPYGVSKCAANYIVRNYRDKYNIFAIQGILYNSESNRRSDDFLSKKILNGFERLRIDPKSGPIQVGNMSARRDWTHATDTVRGIWSMITQETPEEYVLGSGETHKVREVILLAAARAGFQDLYREGGKIVSLEHGVLVEQSDEFYRPTENFVLCADYSKAKKFLGWKPKTRFENIFSKED